MNATVIKTMTACNNYFAVLCERVRDVVAASNEVKAEFKGEYSVGDLVRIHGSFSGSYSEFLDGEVYEVAAFDGETLTLDRPLKTKAHYLFIAYLEPTQEFIDLCERIAEYESKAEGRKGLASESIDGYSWSAASNGTGVFEVFSDELKHYKQPRPTALYYARNALAWG